MGPGRDPSWTPPIVITSATEGDGLDELWEAIRLHEAHLRSQGRLEARRRERFTFEIREIVGERLKAHLEQAAGPDVLEQLTDDVLARKIDPYAAAEELLKRFGL